VKKDYSIISKQKQFSFTSQVKIGVLTLSNSRLGLWRRSKLKTQYWPAYNCKTTGEKFKFNMNTKFFALLKK
jgi:hypothetical protein